MTLCPPKYLKIFGFPLICAAMFAVLGGHWALLQAVAWSQMVVSYSQTDGSLATGLSKTFSGRYPCAMCKRIADEKQKEEQKSPISHADKKTDGVLALTGEPVDAPAPSKFSYLVSPDSLLTSRSDPPPVPVPIAT